MPESTRSHYELLGVDKSATAEEIKAAYRKLARSLHPDTATGSAALFGMVTEAYEVLSKPERRAAYDRAEAAGPAPAAPPRPQPAPQPGPAAGSGSPRPGAGAAGGSGAYRTGAARAPRGPAGPVRVERGAAAAPAWWCFPLVLGLTAAAGSIRFTGLTATLAGAHRGSALVFGADWRGVPSLADAGLAGLARSLAWLAVLCAFLVLAFWTRKRWAPVPRVEKVLLLVVLVVLAGAGEFLLAPARAWAVVLAGVGLYAGWLWLLGQLPQPGAREHWESFPACWAAAWSSGRGRSAGGRRGRVPAWAGRWPAVAFRSAARLRPRSR